MAGFLRNLPCERNVRFIIFRHNEQPRRVLVNTVHNPWTQHAANSAQIIQRI